MSLSAVFRDVVPEPTDWGLGISPPPLEVVPQRGHGSHLGTRRIPLPFLQDVQSVLLVRPLLFPGDIGITVEATVILGLLDNLLDSRNRAIADPVEVGLIGELDADHESRDCHRYPPFGWLNSDRSRAAWRERPQLTFRYAEDRSSGSRRQPVSSIRLDRCTLG